MIKVTNKTPGRRTSWPDWPPPLGKGKVSVITVKGVFTYIDSVCVRTYVHIAPLKRPSSPTLTRYALQKWTRVLVSVSRRAVCRGVRVRVRRPAFGRVGGVSGAWMASDLNVLYSRK